MSDTLGAFQSDGSWFLLDRTEPEESGGTREYLVLSNCYADSWTTPDAFDVELRTTDYEEAKAEFFRIVGLQLDALREGSE